MVLIRECGEEGKSINPTDPAERDQLRKNFLRHATGPDGIIDLDVYNLGLYGENLFSDLFSESSVNSGSDSDCMFLSDTSGTNCREDDCLEVCPFQPSLSDSMGEESPSRSTGMALFAEEVLVEGSLYTDVRVVNLLRSKFNISSTGHEEDVVALSCDADERVCDQEMGGEQDESFLMYMAVLEVFGVKIPFTHFEMDVPKFINVAPSQIRPNSWAFIRGYEILCKSFDLEPSIGPFFPFYGTKDVNKGTWISLSAHARERLFPQYASNYKKEWRDTFARVQGAPKCSTSFVLVDGKPKFPLR